MNFLIRRRWIIALWIVTIGSLLFRIGMLPTAPHVAKSKATGACWVNHIENKFEARFGNCQSDLPASTFIKNLKSQLENAALIDSQVDPDLNVLVQKLHSFDRELVSYLELAIAKDGDKLQAQSMTERMQEGERLLGKIDSDKTLHSEIEADPELQSQLEKLFKFIARQQSLGREVLIMQARMRERYPSSSFDLPVDE